MTAPPGKHASGRDLVSGILTTSIMVAVVIFLGRLSVPLELALPLPMIYYRAAKGRIGGAVILIGAVLFVSLMGSNYISGDEIIYCSSLLFLGLLIQEFLENGLSLEKTVVYSLAGSAGLLLGLLIVTYGGIQHLTDAGVKELQALLKEMPKAQGGSKSGLPQSPDQILPDPRTLVLIILGLRLAGLAFIAWLNLRLARLVYQRMGWAYPVLTRPTHWKAPENLVWVAIACLGGYTFFNGDVKELSMILGIVLIILYLIVGIAIAGFFMNKFRIPGPQQVLILAVGILALVPVAVPVLSGLGLFDLWADFRKLQKKGFTEDNNEGDIN